MSAAVEVRERPILMSGPMVRAILEGRKAQTRRVVKITHRTPGTAAALTPPPGFEPRPHVAAELCPYGLPGNRLWVRETWGVVADKYHRVAYAADHGHTASGVSVARIERGRWRPSIHMPRSACRLVLEVTAIRVQRLQAITEHDAIDEGVHRADRDVGVGDGGKPGWCYAPDCFAGSPRHAFELLWDSINAKRGHAWSTNPWVWVIEFARVAA